MKVLALFRSSWNLKVLVFKLRGKPDYPEKNLSEQGDNQKQPLPTDVSMPRFEPGPDWLNATGSHHCATLDPFFGNFRKMIGNVCTPFEQHADFFFRK